MRRSRIQVKPNIGSRKPACVKNEGSVDNPSSSLPTEGKTDKDAAVSVGQSKADNDGPEKTRLPSEPVEEIPTAMPGEDAAPQSAPGQTARDVPRAASPVVQGSGSVVDSDAVVKSETDGTGAQKAETKPPAPVMRRNKIKPTVRVKPRASSVKNAVPDTPVIGQGGSVAGAAAVTSHPANVSAELSEVCPVIAPDNTRTDSGDSTKQPGDVPLSVKSSARSLSKPSEVLPPALVSTISPCKPGEVVPPALVSTISPSSNDVKDITTVCVIKKEKHEAQDGDFGNKDKTTICVVPKEKGCAGGDMQATAVVRKEVTPSAVMFQDPSATITKVVPGRRSRMLKPKPNLLDSSRQRNRSVSMSASDVEEDLDKKYAHVAPTKTRSEGTASVHVVITKTEDSEGTPEERDNDAPKKSYFQIRAEKEKKTPVRGQVRKRVSMDEPVNKMTMKMCDLIYNNPSGNRMKSSILEEEKKKKRREGKGVDNASVVGSPDRQSVLSAEADESPANSVRETVHEAPEPEAEVEDEPMMVPQVKVGADGQIILNEESLTVAQKRSPLVEHGDADDVLEECANAPYNPQLYYRRCTKSRAWTWRETKRFYLALSVVGTDFALMTQLFKDRTRNDIKKKFKKEEKINRWLVDKALKDTKSYDISLFEQLSESEEEEKEEKKKKPKKEKTAKPPKVAADKASDAKDGPSQANGVTEGKPKKRNRRIRKLYYSGSSESEENSRTEAAQEKPPKNNKSVKKEPEGSTGAEGTKKRQRAKSVKGPGALGGKSVKGPGTPGGKRSKLDHQAVCNISNVSPGQFLLLSEGPDGTHTSDGKGEKMIHMYRISSEPEGTETSTGSASMTSPPAFIAVPLPAHQKAIKEAMNVSDNDANPFSNYLAGRITGIVPRKRSVSQSSAGKKTPKARSRRQEEEEEKIMLDLTALGRPTFISDVTPDKGPAKRKNKEPLAVTVDLNLAGGECSERGDVDSKRGPTGTQQEGDVASPQIVSIVRLPENPDASNRILSRNESVDQNMEQDTDATGPSEFQVNSLGEYSHLTSECRTLSYPGASDTEPIMIDVKPSHVGHHDYTVKDISSVFNTENYPSENTVVDSHKNELYQVLKEEKVLESNNFSNLSDYSGAATGHAMTSVVASTPDVMPLLGDGVTLTQSLMMSAGCGIAIEDTEGRLQSPPATKRMVSPDSAPVGLSFGSTNLHAIPQVDAQSQMGTGPTVVTTASVCLIPSMPKIATTASLCLVTPPAFATISQAPPIAPVFSQMLSPNSIAYCAPETRTGPGSDLAPVSGEEDVSVRRPVPDTFSHLSPYRTEPRPLEANASTLESNRPVSSTHSSSKPTDFSQSPSQGMQVIPGSKSGPAVSLGSVAGHSTPVRVAHCNVLPSPSSYAAHKIEIPLSGHRSGSSPNSGGKTRLPQATFVGSPPSKRSQTRLPQATFKPSPSTGSAGRQTKREGNSTRLPTATFAENSHENDWSASDDVSETQEGNSANQSAPPEDWLEESSRECVDGVQTIKIRILKGAAEQPPKQDPEQQDLSGSGEIRLFVG